jgi:hypothetical protein
MIKISNKKKYEKRLSSRIYLLAIGLAIITITTASLVLSRPIETFSQGNCWPRGEERLSLLKNGKAEIDQIRQTVAEQARQLEEEKAKHRGAIFEHICKGKSYKLYVF